MARWYWLEWRTVDHVALYARLWQRLGLACSIGYAVFLGVGAICLIIALPDVEHDIHNPQVAAVLAGPAIALGVFFIAAVHAASLANSVADRLKELNGRIDELHELIRHDGGAAGVSGS